jgi:exodeoxyribonuclease V alpha subunit
VTADVDRVSELGPWRAAGVLSAADVHIAATLARLGRLGDSDDERLVVLGAALAVRAPRQGHVCLDLRSVRESAEAEVDRAGEHVTTDLFDALPWPDDVDEWLSALSTSPIVAMAGSAPEGPPRPLVLDGDLLYLDRYRDYEAQVATSILVRVGAEPTPVAIDATRRDGLFDALGLSAEQREAAIRGATRSLSVIVGGPGTGKTHTVAALLALLYAGVRPRGDEQLRIALVAPTGKAAARMAQAIRDLASTIGSTGIDGASEIAARLRSADTGTIHRRLGWRPGSSGFRHDASNPLPYDVVIVDETSMVSLPLMARLLDAIDADARVVLVGDPGQLASVEAGSVLGDIAGPVVDAVDGSQPAPVGDLAACVSVLAESRRFPSDSPVGRFAAAVRADDADAAMAELRASSVAAPRSQVGGGGPAVTLTWYDRSADADDGAVHVRDEAFAAALTTRDEAGAGDADAALEALSSVRVLCAHREGPFGVSRWNWQFEQWLSADGPRLSEFYVGRPVLVTRNDPANDVFNGDLGVVIDDNGVTRIAFPGPDGPRRLLPLRLEGLETVHAMTIHKSQGSEFDRVVVVMPPPESRLATRELLYTAVTRARTGMVLIGTEESVRAAIGRRVQRASGLGALLWSA